MPKLWEKTDNLKTNDDLAVVDLSQRPISGPTVIYFPGRDASDSAAKEISKGTYFVNGLFKNLPSPPQVYTYSHRNRYARKNIGYLSSIFRVAVYSYLPRLRSGRPARDLAQKLIMPLVSTPEGGPLPFEEAQKNLRNLTFLGYCLGTVAAQELYNASVKMMQKSGYSKEDARKLLREVVLVSFATFTRPKKEDDRYTTVAFLNTDDLFLSLKNMLVLPQVAAVTLSKSFFSASQKLKITALSNTSILVSAAARGRPLRRMLGIKQKEVIEGVKLPRWSPKATNHQPRDYGLNADDERSQVAGMAQYALLNALNRKDTLLNPVDLLNPPATLGAEETAHYLSRIETAKTTLKDKRTARKEKAVPACAP